MIKEKDGLSVQLDFHPRNFEKLRDALENSNASQFAELIPCIIGPALHSRDIFTFEIEGVGIVATEFFINKHTEEFTDPETGIRKIIFQLGSDIIIQSFTGKKMSDAAQIRHSDYWEHFQTIPIKNIRGLSFINNKKGYGYGLKITIKE